jgi:hypothetical protein
LAEISVAIYPVGGQHHRWHGQLWGDISLLALGPRALWRLGLSMQTVADYGNSIDFRLTRVYYDAATGVDLRLGPGVLSLGYRHRCSHGADSAIPGRILIRSGFDLSYRAHVELGRVDLRGEGVLQATVIGQNQDASFQPRALLYGGLGLTVALVGQLDFVASVAIGVGLVGQGSGSTFSLSSPSGELSALPLPAAAVGLHWGRGGLAGRLILHYQRLLDSGITDQAQQLDLVSLRFEFLSSGIRRQETQQNTSSVVD